MSVVRVQRTGVGRKRGDMERYMRCSVQVWEWIWGLFFFVKCDDSFVVWFSGLL